MLDHVLDRLAQAGVTSGALITNRRFFPHFVRWAGGGSVAFPLELLDDGTDSNQTRLGSMGDLDFALRAGDIRGDFLVVNGDNLFSFALRPVLDMFHQRGSTIVLYDVRTLELARQMGIARCDATGRIDFFVEKSFNPPSTMASTGIYAFRAEVRQLIADYLATGHKPDRTGDFVTWLYPRIPVFGYVVRPGEGLWFDIGTPDQYQEADETWRQLYPR
jgi:glucose-1-phosphate thymidylyltransferase